MIDKSTGLENTTAPAITYSECYRLPFLSLFHADCMEIMNQYPDNHFDLAIVDPPYGIGADLKNSKRELKSKKSAAISSDFGGQIWDSAIPTEEYFAELKRISKKQIIWGANYFGLVGGMLYWHKDVTMPTYSTGELAWLSWLQKIDFVNITWHGMLQHNMKDKEIRLHPTQKPVALYDWLLKHYAEPNQKILDTHLGSGSIAIAIEKANRLDKMNLQFVGIEIDKEYFEKALNRIEQYCRQGTLSF
ncbi:MAG TPA: DNA methyltransferase [Treponemataceae bacterium]|nr:DNA methyltransferase [Treponemataceae bacterium]